jgi:GrpB-like predicted nucleotidyltransferase (UPF0157 family)
MHRSITGLLEEFIQHEGNMTKVELGQLYPITLSEYTNKWTQLYEKESHNLQNILGPNIALGIEHIGSTAVPGMIAKPTVDILVDIPENFGADQIIEKLAKEDYIHMKEVTDHILFVKGYTPTGLAEESYHIHMGPKSQQSLWDRLYFRDYLIMNPHEQDEYTALKLSLQKQYKHDREAYTHGKDDYIKRITQKGKEALMSN